MEQFVALDRVRKARVALCEAFTFFGAGALALEPVVDNSQPTGWTDGKRIGFNEEFVAKVTWNHLLFFIAHEVGHCYGHTHQRRNGRDGNLWNKASDYKVNELLELAGFALLPGVLRDTRFDRMTTEQVYDILAAEEQAQQQQKQKQQEQDEQEQDQQDSGDEQGDQQEQGEGEEDGSGEQDAGEDGAAGEAGEDGDEDADGGCAGEAGEGDTGSQEAEGTRSGAGAGGSEGGEEVVDHGQAGTVRDAVDEGAAGEDGEAVDWDVVMTQAKNLASKAGTLPGELEAWVEAKLTPVLSWEELLRQWLDARARDDYRWTKPNKRYAGEGVMLPGMVNDGIDTLAIVFDTSGSTRDFVQQFASELRGFLDSGVRVNKVLVMACDTRLTVREYDPQCDEIEFQYRGGGGTSFSPPFQWLEEHGEQPAALVYLTDLEGSCDVPDPGYPVLWIQYGKSRWAQQPSFGEVVMVD